ncbi:ribulose-phosphate 3-epimerase [Fenollaria massiliensis]|uniref:Ribulose-phosphate 3-epimerase n=1 Tax=Fenollaria massiliensis TaxID=938288 RepID=A0A9E7DKV4_9FIRM|nr:ribulose-phosphate 3-epimerase [Fenollaria massiliensis]UQK59642.1 ribulose-phosphate 3-epimerase [Fenollaria massiliensis]
MREIAPSLLSANFYNLQDDLERLKKSGIKYLHLDVMDGNFVPNISFGLPIIKSVRKNTDFILDCHLMIEKPERYLEDFKNAGADILTVHQEATIHLQRTLAEIRRLGMKAGVSLNPSTSEETLKYIMDDLDLILIMSVNPGFGGQSYIESVNEKIKRVRKMIDESERDIILEVDGGVNKDNIKELEDLGVDLFVAGSAAFKNSEIEKNIGGLRDDK